MFLASPTRRSPLHLLERPAEKARYGLLLVHGMNEYIGRYVQVADHFSQSCHLAGVDLYGHGLTNPLLRAADQAILSGERRFDASAAFLEQAALTTLNPMRADFKVALAHVLERQRGSVFVLAHSLGGLVAASALQALDREKSPVLERLAGIILVGPAFAISRLPEWRGWLANPLLDFSFKVVEKALAKPARVSLGERFVYLGARLLAAAMEAGMDFLSRPGLREVFSPRRPDWVIKQLTDWPEEKQRLRTDPYLLGRTMLSFVLGIEKEIAIFRQQMRDFKLPYFLIYATGDCITAAWGNTDFIRATLSHHPDNRVLPLAVPYHEQLFMAPPKPQQLLAAIDEWMQRRLRADSAKG